MEQIVTQIINACNKYDGKKVEMVSFPECYSYIISCENKGGAIEVSKGQVNRVDGDDNFKRHMEKELNSPIKF